MSKSSAVHKKQQQKSLGMRLRADLILDSTLDTLLGGAKHALKRRDKQGIIMDITRNL